MEPKEQTDPVSGNIFQVDGCKICVYWEEGIDLENFSNPPLLILHGAMRHSAHLLSLYPGLSQKFQVFYCDLPGHGNSSALKKTTMESMSQTLFRVMDHLFKNREVTLLGESLGALISLHLASHHPDKICSIILADPILSTGIGKLGRIPSYFADYLKDPSLDRTLYDIAVNIFGLSPDGLNNRQILYYSLFGEISSPCLILTGNFKNPTTSDPCFFDEEDSLIIERTFDNKAVIVQIDNCGHNILEMDPNACIQAIFDFCFAPDN